jgi:protein SCO1/2
MNALNTSRRNMLQLAVALPVAGLAPPVLAASARPRNFRASYFPNVEATAHTGQKLRFYDDLLKDRMVLVNFTYATCDGLCPIVTQNLKKVYALLGDRVGRDIFMYSITLRPSVDTVDVLREHVEMHAMGPGWLYLHMRPDDLLAVRRRFGAVDPDPVIDADYTQHSAILHLGNVPLERWIGCPGEARAEWIAKSMLGLEGPPKQKAEPA